MDEKEFRQFMEYLYRQYVEHRISSLRGRHGHRFDENWRHACDNARRFRLRYTSNDNGLRSVSKNEALQNLRFARDLSEDSGFIDALDAHFHDIARGMRVEHLPKADVEVLRHLGSSYPEVELAALVQIAKSDRLRCLLGLCDSLDNLLGKIDKILDDGEVVSDKNNVSEKEVRRSPATASSWRWFKGLGSIAKGTALAGANVGLAAGLLILPVDPMTQTWGALLSGITGFGDAITGFGELRGE